MRVLIGIVSSLLSAGEPEPLVPCTQELLTLAARNAPAPDPLRVNEALFHLYLKADKIDWVPDKVRRGPKGKKVVTYRQDPFGWKDAEAAARLGMPLKDYVLRADDGLLLRLYCLVAAAKADGHEPVISSIFRDDWRQAQAKGTMVARVGHSFHGGSLRGGQALAADVTVNGPWNAKRAFWDWIRAKGRKFYLAQPYALDPAHVVPTDGAEYAGKARHTKTRFATHQKHRRAAKKKRGVRLARG